MNTGEQRQWKMTKPTLEDAWSSAFETAIERATMLALREIGSVIAKKAADDAAKGPVQQQPRCCVNLAVVQEEDAG